MLSVGKHHIPDLDGRSVRMTTGFAGGIGDSRQEICGAFSSGIMIIGALDGRTHPNQDDTRCFHKTLTYREKFTEELGSISCFELRASGYGSDGIEPCSILVERAARVLLGVL